MAQPYVSGPAHIYVGATDVVTTRQGTFVNSNDRSFIGASAGPNFYLGTCEQYPVASINAGWEPLFNDVGGSVIPHDIVYQGEEAFIFMTLSRWNEGVYAALASRADPATALRQGVAFRGSNVAGEIGALMLNEVRTFTLWVTFPHSTKILNTTGQMPPGYRFFTCTLEGPDQLDPLGGTVPRKLNLTVHAWRQYFPLTQDHQLYDHNTGNLPLAD